MRNGRRESARRLREVFFEPWIRGVDELVGGSVEDDPAFVQDEKLGAVIDAIVGYLLHFASLRVEVASRQEEGVLQAVRDDERGGVGNIALLDDEIDDGC